MGQAITGLLPKPSQTTQDPLAALEVHLTHDISKRMYVSLDSYSKVGGGTSSDGHFNDNQQLWTALGATVGDRVSFHRPEGGMFLWTTVDGVPDTAALLRHAVEAGVAFVPGSAFTIDQAPDSKARLSYSTLTPGVLGEAVRRLSVALAAYDAA